MNPVDRLVLPLDVPSLSDAQRWVELMRGHVGVFKVGLELFTAVGPSALNAVHSAGARSFLDLKLHDIPATMARATQAAVAQGASYLTVHTAAGPTALAAVAEVARGTQTKLLGVSVLTSMSQSDLEKTQVQGSIADVVVERVVMAVDAGLDGFVCSPLECAVLRERFGTAITLVVPGIRPAGSAADDQTRRATPSEAVARGADLLVVGRPIRNADDPVAAAQAIVTEIARA